MTVAKVSVGLAMMIGDISDPYGAVACVEQVVDSD